MPAPVKTPAGKVAPRACRREASAMPASGGTGAGRRRYGLLLLATLLSLGVQGIAPPSDVKEVTVSLLSGASIVLALRAAQLRPWVLRVGASLAAVVVALTIVHVTAGGIGEGAARAMNAALVAFGPPAVALGVYRELRTVAQVRV